MANAFAVYAFDNGDEIRVGMDADWATPDVLPELHREVIAMLKDAIVSCYDAMHDDDEADHQ